MALPVCDQAQIEDRVKSHIDIKKLMIVYSGQTGKERSEGATIKDNGKGFNKFDAPILTPIAEAYESQGWIARSQLEEVSHRMRLPPLDFVLAWMLLWYIRKELTMTETNATSEYCCTCQSWHGIRKYEPRRGKVKYENRAPDTPCNMNYRKPGACPKGNCRGYVRWVELG